MPATDDILDCLVIGAGPAGLTAATYLVRFRRRIAVVDAGASRARWIPVSHNCPGFPAGVAGRTLLARLREQAEEFGAAITPGRVTGLERVEDGFVATVDDGRRLHARFVLLATGIVDRMPPLADLEQAIADGAVRLCAVCDGYEASDESIAVYGPVNDAIRHAAFLRTYSCDVTAIRSEPGEPDAAAVKLAEAAGIALLPVPARLQHGEGHCEVTLDDGSVHGFETLYPVLGGDAQSGLAVALGAAVDDNRELVVDAALQTSVDGLYAIGDIASALNQISVAVGHAAIAATAIHNRLPRNFREETASRPEPVADGAGPPA